VPFVVIVALAFGALSGGSDASSAAPTNSVLPAITASAPPHAEVQTTNCTHVLENLPVSLTGLKPRVVHTTPVTPFVVAWGDPAVVLRCGVDRPADLKPGSSTEFYDGGVITGPYYDVTSDATSNVFTTVDRAVYLSITVPAKYESGPLPTLSRAIAKALPPVCSTDPKTLDVNELCTRRA
jgi:hypothetical protein